MKVMFLILTLLFTTSVLADCCNFEAPSTETVSIEHGQTDDCGTDESHTDSQHCHCPNLGHVKILSESRFVILQAPVKISTAFATLKTLELSNFESRIFHPPRA